jgi:hypothetical protein
MLSESTFISGGTMLNILRNKRCYSYATKPGCEISLYVYVLLLHAARRSLTAVTLKINTDLMRQFVFNFWCSWRRHIILTNWTELVSCKVTESVTALVPYIINVSSRTSYYLGSLVLLFVQFQLCVCCCKTLYQAHYTDHCTHLIIATMYYSLLKKFFRFIWESSPPFCTLWSSHVLILRQFDFFLLVKVIHETAQCMTLFFSKD